MFGHLRAREWVLVMFGLVFIVAQVYLDLKLPDYMAEITRLVQTQGSQMRDIYVQGGYMLLVALGVLATAIAIGYISATVGSGVAQSLRSAMFNKVNAFSMGEINKFSTPSLITRTTNDISQVEVFFIIALQLLIKSPILAVWGIIKISGKGYEWTLAMGTAVTFIVLVLVLLIIFVLPKFKHMQKLTDDLNKVARENLTGLPVVRAYNAEKFQQTAFERTNNDLTKTNLFVSRGTAFMNPAMQLAISSLPLAIYIIGAILITNTVGTGERLSLFSNMVVFSAYAIQVLMAFMFMSMVFIFLPRATVSAKRINEVLDTKTAIVDGAVTANSMGGRMGTVEFRNVSFKYPNAVDKVLSNISFTVQKGETVAFIGSTGSGKSSLINLIPRFFDVTEGAVLINGVDVRDYKLATLHGLLGYVPQRAVMFSGTVASNVALGTETTAPMVERAVRIAQGDFVFEMENGISADLSRDGKNVSGGQKQRLAIARAIYRNPEIYIFDDSFSALDYKTDKALRHALKTEIAGATVLIVAQRIGTIREADKIIVLDNGKIVGAGKHAELLKSCSVYREIAAGQLTEKELK